MEIAYDERGLVPVVVQDWRTGEVLTLAYANAEAVARTRETGELHLWSRSRDELWHKGATSGHTQRVRALRLQRLVPALPPRALTIALRALGAQPLVDRAFGWYLEQAHPRFAERADR